MLSALTLDLSSITYLAIAALAAYVSYAFVPSRPAASMKDWDLFSAGDDANSGTHRRDNIKS
jgi:hypothetical protein